MCSDSFPNLGIIEMRFSYSVIFFISLKNNYAPETLCFRSIIIFGVLLNIFLVLST